jgi:hypothetical protein
LHKCKRKRRGSLRIAVVSPRIWGPNPELFTATPKDPEEGWVRGEFDDSIMIRERGSAAPG